MNKKRLITILGVCLFLALILIFGFRNTSAKSKLKIIDDLVQEYKLDSNKQIEVMTELNKLKKSKNNKISKKATDSYNLIQELATSRGIFKTIKNTLENKNFKYLSDSEKARYVKELENVSEVSEYYNDAQELIFQLGAESENTNNSNKSIVAINRYTIHSSAGSKELEITLTNTSGSDIDYIALDILEIDKEGNVLNSDWTNSSALFLDNAKITIKTYFDYQSSQSDLEFRIRDVRYK